jgi:hypothetical protein
MTPATANQSRDAYRQDSPVGELPVLVGLLAILIGLFGIFFLIIGTLLALTALGIGAFPAAMAFSPIGGTLLFAGAVTLVFGAVLVTVATGLWDLETWALYVTGIVIAVVIASLVLSASFGWALLIAALLFVYLVAVRNHFY